METWAYFYIAGLFLLVVEGLLFTGGFVLSAALTCFLIGVLNWANLLTELNHLLLASAISCAGFCLLIVGYFHQSQKSKNKQENDINNY